MNGHRIWGLLACTLATAACGGATQASAPPPDGAEVTPADGALVTAEWVYTSSCWKEVSAAAYACTDQSAAGTFDAARTTCTYADGTVVHVDPEVTPTSRGPWAFTVVSSTGTTCAQYGWTLGPTGFLARAALTTRIGTFTADLSSTGAVFTCPDGTRFRVEDHTCDGVVGTCGGGFYPPLGTTAHLDGPDGSASFSQHMPPGYLWNCRAP